MTVVVVGAGLAGLRTCEALRQHGWTGSITLVGAETHLPYSRPPLSKEVLRGDAPPESATLRQPDELAALDLDLRLGVHAVGLAPDDRRVDLADGSRLDYEHVVIATGATPRRLPGAEGAGTHVLRTIDDCLALSGRLRRGGSVVVVGAGFIGLEVAASAVARGCRVTVVDVLPAPLARVLPPHVGAAVARLHTERDVAVRCGVGVGVVRRDGVDLADGTSIDADAVVVGVGVVPETAWLDGSGLALDDGVVCDETLQAAPGVWAVGDAARWRLPSGTTARVEHWTNATEQPQIVARSIVSGSPQPFTTVPYFWSDQYDAKLQCLGVPSADDELHVVAGSLDEPKWVALTGSAGRLTGVVGLRMPGRVMKLRPLLAQGAGLADALATATA